MRIDERRGTEAASSKSNGMVRVAVQHGKRFQRAAADDFNLFGKLSNEFHCCDREEEEEEEEEETEETEETEEAEEEEEEESVTGPSWSFRSVSAITTTNETRGVSDLGRYDTSSSGSDTIQPLGYSTLYKYRNPYSLSINNRYLDSLSNARGNILEDEPQEGKAKGSILLSCREYLANYQESCGIPRTEYSYAALIIVMAQATARSLWALIYIFINVAPVIQMFSFILRFVLDKVINIRSTEDVQQIIIKSAILVVQLLSVYICLMFILGFIVLPIIQMAIGIATKFIVRD